MTFFIFHKIDIMKPFSNTNLHFYLVYRINHVITYWPQNNIIIIFVPISNCLNLRGHIIIAFEMCAS